MTCSRSQAAKQLCWSSNSSLLTPHPGFLPANLCDKTGHTLLRVRWRDGGGNGSWHQTQSPWGSLSGRAGQNLARLERPRGGWHFPLKHSALEMAATTGIFLYTQRSGKSNSPAELLEGRQACGPITLKPHCSLRIWLYMAPPQGD